MSSSFIVDASGLLMSTSHQWVSSKAYMNILIRWKEPERLTDSEPVRYTLGPFP